MNFRLTVALLAMLPATAFAGFMNSLAFVPVPTLDDVGLYALIGLIGGLAGWLARQHKK